MADDDEPTKRASHFNEQRASLRSDTSRGSSNTRSRSRHQSLLSQRQSQWPTNDGFELYPDRADSETLPSPPGSPSPAPVIPRDRSETLASHEREQTQSKRWSAGRDSATSRSKSRTRDSATSRSKSRTRAPSMPRSKSRTRALSMPRSKSRTSAPSRGRNIEDLLIAASWDHLDFLSSPPPDMPPGREEYWRAKSEINQSSASNLPQPSSSRNAAVPRTPSKTSRRPSLFSCSNASSSPRSQNGITALPIMAPPTAADDAPQLSGAERYHRSQPTAKAQRMSRLATEVYTICFLIFFAIWGSLARLGLQALTFYPGAPVVFSELWANVAGTFVMGFLAGDVRLFRDEWGSHGGEAAVVVQPVDWPAEGHESLERQGTFDKSDRKRHGTFDRKRHGASDRKRHGASDKKRHGAFDKKRHGQVKKTIPLYIGLTTGFCGSLTSFSSFVRDVFLGLSNDLPAPTYHATSAPSTLVHRQAGYSVMALLGVVLVTVALCLCSLKAGAHLAAALDGITPTLPFGSTRRLVDPLFVVAGIGSWIGAVALACRPPHDAWRGQALFACVFAPLGCLGRYYASLALNSVNPAFPLGTFVCNMFGTAVLGMSYNLQRVAIRGVAGGGLVGCQVLQGIEDGFCGALTTVSTWMLELDTLPRTHAYVYGASSVVVGVSMLTVVMGSVRWSVGWEAVACAT
ncbi:uncharacterized protein M421DRAFT_415495 [Didymella exigua CBS 183.55]|uniref:CrcB-like protein n=1 Tax=Didymella exigua CBS 183.55 TaxID=1150837 RepID=A0A6A5RZU7_9PLEO|nr:uncharacterized protein M421DRAFT_415495 [Didymella exigua CBS 183.55]KAF1933133.1 hypothetical protein M421DRAFT_415495 [Didymella exigua CBS 183.55]